MVKITGQKKLLEKLDKYTLASFPHTVLFIGDKGSGKELIAKYIADKFGMVFKTIDSDTTAEQLIEYNQSPIKTLYIIRLADFTEKQQNMVLKFIEEPSNTVYIALTAESEIGILPTILSRCIKFRMDPYTIEELKEVSWVANLDKTTADLVFKVCKTPGQLVNITEKVIKDIYEICGKVIKSLKVASYANTLSLATKINYKENYSKFDFNLFLNILEYTAFNDYLNNKNNDSLKIYLFINERKQRLINKPYNKEAFMVNLLSDLWKETR